MPYRLTARSRFVSSSAAALFVAFIAGLISLPPQTAHAEDQSELIEMVLGFVGESDKDIRAIAFEQIRTKVPGDDATKRFAEELPKLSEEAQIGLLSALADRGDATAKPAVINIAKSAKSEPLQVAAVSALGKLGDGTDAPQLIELFSKNGKVATVARQSLVDLQGEGITKTILTGIKNAPDASKIRLIDLLTTRRAMDAIPNLLTMAKGSDGKIRAAAMKSLGQLASADHIPGMVTGVLSAVVGNERNDAEKNLMFVCNRIKDKEERAAPLLAALKGLSSADRTAMIPTLGRVGGAAALKEVDKAIASRDSKVHYMGIRAISNWPDASVADRLMKIAENDKHADHKRIARMSLLRIAPLPDGRTDEQKLELLKTSMKLAANDKETNYGLKRAAPIRLVETLRFVLPYIDQSKFSAQACQTVVDLAHDRGLRDNNKSEFHAALDKVIATTKDEVLIDRANRYKAGKTWVRSK